MNNLNELLNQHVKEKGIDGISLLLPYFERMIYLDTYKGDILQYYKDNTPESDLKDFMIELKMKQRKQNKDKKLFQVLNITMDMVIPNFFTEDNIEEAISEIKLLIK